MINSIKTLYEAARCGDNIINPFFTPEYNKLFDTVYDEYICPKDTRNGIINTDGDGYDKLYDLTENVRYTGFEIGYKTALQLVIPNLFGDTIIDSGVPCILPKEKEMLERYSRFTVDRQEKIRKYIEKLDIEQETARQKSLEYFQKKNDLTGSENV